MRDWRLGEILGLDGRDLVDGVRVRRGDAGGRGSDNDGLGDGLGVLDSKPGAADACET